MLKFHKMLFFNTLMLGTLVSVSSYSWLSMWMGLEINLLSIIPLLSSMKNLYPSEAALKYFVTQAMASIILLFAIIVALSMSEFLPKNYNLLLLVIMNSALLTKMGAAPFHYWFPEVMEGLNWGMGLIMLTWQKIAPMVLLMYNLNMSFFIVSVIILSSLIGGISGLNQTSLRKILAYSSINHIGWMLASMLFSQSIWMIYFTIYSVITLNIILILKYLNIFYLKQLFNVINFSKSIKFLFVLNFLSLGGLPPFLGFFPKWLTINHSVYNSFFLMSMILIVSTLITLFFYLRIMFSTLVINSNEMPMQNVKSLPLPIFIFNFISLSGLPFCTFFLSMF